MSTCIASNTISGVAYGISGSPLGEKTAYVSHYAPELLFPIARKHKRTELGILPDGDLPFYGLDLWSAYELSWLNARGKPCVALAQLEVPAESPFLIESKSLKLYFNSLNASRFETQAELESCLRTDLSLKVGLEVGVRLFALDADVPDFKLGSFPQACCLDGLEIDCQDYQARPDFLKSDPVKEREECLLTHLLKSNCPVTGQPDWASLLIAYKGPQIDQQGLLRYVVSLREHCEFHEHCVERIFMEILNRCQPTSLSVFARYTRRGGLEINPFRSTEKGVRPPRFSRLIRQ